MQYQVWLYDEKLFLECNQGIFWVDVNKLDNYPCPASVLPCGIAMDDGDLSPEDWKKLDYLVFLIEMNEK